MLDRNALLELIGKDVNPALTITMPAHRTMPAAQENPIRFKNLLDRAREALAAYRADEDAVARLTDRAAALVDDYDFWQHQKDGLAVFSAEGIFRVERVAAELPESVQVGRGFAVKPFLRLLEPAPGYYVLAAAWDNVRLFRSGAEGLKPVKEDALPETIMRFAGMTEVEDNVHFHASGPTPPTGGEGAAMYHGQGTAPPEEEEKLHNEFARELAKQADRLLSAHQKADLVLIADERLSGMFTGHVKSDVIQPPEARISPANMTATELHDVARQAAGSRWDRRGDARIETLYAHFNDAGSDKASTDPREIAKALLAGRVADLFVDPEREIPGHVDETTGELDQAGGMTQAQGDLADAFARLTLKQGGEVHAVSGDKLPDKTGLAALYRY